MNQQGWFQTQRFMSAAMEAIRNIPSEEHFIVDDVWARMPEDLQVGDKRVMGAALRAAADRGWIRKTGMFKPSAQPQCHGNPRQVWRAA